MFIWSVDMILYPQSIKSLIGSMDIPSYLTEYAGTTGFDFEKIINVVQVYHYPKKIN